MVAACQRKRVTFQFDIDITREPGLLTPFDRIVVATGAAYPLGLGPLAMGLLDRGAGHWPGLSARITLGARLVLLSRAVQPPTTQAVGKAWANCHRDWRCQKPGKAREAIASAFEAALLGQ
jgi:hypothetical protein